IWIGQFRVSGNEFYKDEDRIRIGRPVEVSEKSKESRKKEKKKAEYLGCDMPIARIGEVSDPERLLHHDMHKLMRRGGILQSLPDACHYSVKILKSYLKSVIDSVVEKKKTGEEEESLEVSAEMVLDAL